MINYDSFKEFFTYYVSNIISKTLLGMNLQEVDGESINLKFPKC